MYSKSERLALELLSEELFDSSAVYRRFAKQKILADVVTTKVPRMVTVNKGGTKMHFNNAVARGLVSATDKDGNAISPTIEKHRPVYRQPTFEEVRDAMYSAAEMKKFNEIPPVHILLLSAVKFVKGELMNMPYLVVSESQKRDYEAMVELIPEDLRDKMAKMVVPQGNNQVFCVDGFQFASDVVFATNRLEEAEALLVKYDMGEVPDMEEQAAEA